MTTYAALYGLVAATIDRAWVEANAEGAQVEQGPASPIAATLFTLRWGDESITVRGALDERHREKTVERIMARCEDSEGDAGPVLDALRRCRALLFLSFPAVPPETGRARRWVRRIQRSLDAVLVHDLRVEDADGVIRLRLTPEDDGEVQPPDPERISRRARVLAAVVARAHFEQAPATAQLSRLWDWLDAQRLWSETELAERELIRAERGAPRPQLLSMPAGVQKASRCWPGR